MSLLPDEHRKELTSKILFAASQDEVKRLIDAAINTQVQTKLNSDAVAQFVEKISGELELFNPVKKDPQQWSNIQMAKILLRRLKQQLKVPVN
jgi:hypothetical protein